MFKIFSQKEWFRFCHNTFDISQTGTYILFVMYSQSIEEIFKKVDEYLYRPFVLK